MRTAAGKLTLALRIILGSTSFAVVMTTLTLVTSSSAQNGSQAQISEPLDSPDYSPPDAQPSEGRATKAGVDQASGPDTGDDGPDLIDLVTGLPMKYFLTPFHWGRLSLVSFTAYEGYNSNPNFEQVPLGSSVTSISALALYSAKFDGWQMNLQYQPFVWISSDRTFKDFAAVSLDLRTLHHINPNWRWIVGDRFRYSPVHGTDEEKGFVSNPGGGFGFGNAFLSSGRNVLSNGVHAALIDRYSENSSLTFYADQSFNRLSSYLGTQPSDSIPVQQAITFSTGVTWRDHFSLRNTLSLKYVYELQTSTAVSEADWGSHSASLGLSHRFTSGFAVSGSLGPAWLSSTESHSPSAFSGRATLHGTLALSKQFHRGTALLSFSRSNDFTGIISDRFHNRYDAEVHREFSPRITGSITASYIEQQITSTTSTTGLLASSDIRYLLRPAWALFAEVRYLDIGGSQRLFAPEKSVIVGFRWSWVPEKP